MSRTLREPFLWLLLLLMVVAVLLAYRAPIDYHLDIGGGPTGGVYDRPYLLGGFNIDPEFDSPEAPTRAFRWTGERARLRFPGLGPGSIVSRLDVAAGQNSNGPVAMGWELSGEPLLTVPLAGGPRAYHLLLPHMEGDLDLGWQTPTFQPSGDARRLGFAAERFSFAMLGPSLPPLDVPAWLGGALIVGYMLARRWRVPALARQGLGVAAVATMGLLLVTERPGTTTYLPRLFVMLVLAYPLTLLLEALFRSAARGLGLGTNRVEARAVTALVVLAWIIRFGGLLHPQAYTSDLGLHTNNLRDVTRGTIIFTEDLPARAGGGPAPYPPGQYVMLLPWSLIVDLDWLVEGGNSLADSLVIAALWLLLRSAGAAPITALFAGGLYLFAMPLLVSLSIGEMANVWGQALVAPLVLALYRWQENREGHVSAMLLGSLLMVALLGHFGVFLSLGLFLAAYVAWMLPRRRKQGLQLGMVLVGALLIVVALYYSAHAAIILGRERPPVPFDLTRVSNALLRAVGATGRIGPLSAALAVVGLWLLNREQSLASLRPLIIAWWLSTLLSLLTLLVTEQALRWEAFVYPSVALCGGMTLAAIHRRDLTGRLLAYGLLLLVVLRGAVLWYSQLATYLH